VCYWCCVCACGETARRRRHRPIVLVRAGGDVYGKYGRVVFILARVRPFRINYKSLVALIRGTDLPADLI
jgi:hypothetical protein